MAPDSVEELLELVVAVGNATLPLATCLGILHGL